MKKIMLSAGEVSGDLHAARLVKELRPLLPGTSFFGLGGEKMAAEGVKIECSIIKHGSVGISEALPNLLPVHGAFHQMKKLLKDQKPDLLILVDAQGFNVPLARFAKKQGIKTLYYIAPQEWLWGTEKGLRKVAGVCDKIIAIFEDEFMAYKDVGADIVYFGHPLVDIAKPSMNKEEFLKIFGLSSGNKIVALCPGSRSHEIKVLLPILLQTAKKLKKNFLAIQFVMPIADSSLKEAILGPVKASGIEIKIIEKKNYDVLAYSDVVIATSGTINLEATILGTPNIMFYKLSKLSYLIGKYILKISLPYFSMPNLIAKEKIVPEFVQEEANPNALSKECAAFLTDLNKVADFKDKALHLKEKLGKDVIRKVAGEVSLFLA